MELELCKHGFVLSDFGADFTFECGGFSPKMTGNICEVCVRDDIPMPKTAVGDRIILPIDEGMAIYADGEYENGEFDNGNVSAFGMGRGKTLDAVILQRGGAYLIFYTSDGLHSGYSAVREDGLYRLYARCDRSMTAYYGVFPSIAAACLHYRAVQSKSTLTLADKMKLTPELAKLVGGAIFWIWNDSYDKIMYSDRDTDDKPETGEALLKIAEDFKSNGIDRAMFGIFFDGDSEYVGELYDKYGYISTQYDNYNDVLNPEMLSIIPNNRVKNCGYTRRRMKDYPDGVCVAADGSLAKAWALRGYDGEMHSQNTLCPAVAAQRMREEIPQILSEYPKYKGRFIDVYGGGFGECRSKVHPLSRDECRKVKEGAFESIRKMGLITGTEDGCESIIDSLDYAEGLHSPVNFRNLNSGRNHANTYTEQQAAFIDKYMLNCTLRVPMWQLVYHDRLIAFPYWGDSTEMSPEQIRKKTLFACLYGCQPLYSFSLRDYERLREHILSSYKAISAVTGKTALLPMTDFSYLNDDMTVQRTAFGDKYSVTVNFSDKVFKTESGAEIEPLGMAFDEISGSNEKGMQEK